MSLLKSKSTKPAEVESHSAPRSLAVAYGVQKQAVRKKSPTVTRQNLEESEDRPYTSVAEAILKKRQKVAAVESEDPSILEDLNELAAEDPIDTLDDTLVDEEVPTDRISQIRAKMRAKMGKE